MPARRGVYTISGQLTHYLDELDLSRKDLADELGVNVRTIHNIEHGRKRVDRLLLNRVADVLNQLAKRHRQIPLSLTADHFVRDPDANVNVLLQTIAENDPTNLFVGDSPIAASDLLWRAPGRSLGIPFAGEYSGHSVRELYRRLHQTFGVVGLTGVRILRDHKNEYVTVRTSAIFRHLESGNLCDINAYLHIALRRSQIQALDSNYDLERLAEFLKSGVPPIERKSGRE